MVALPLQRHIERLAPVPGFQPEAAAGVHPVQVPQAAEVQAGHERVFPGGMEEQRPACGGLQGLQAPGTVLQVGGQRLAAQGLPGAAPWGCAVVVQFCRQREFVAGGVCGTGCQPVAPALGAGQVYGGAAPFGLALVIGCPPSYCLAAALGTLAAGLAFQPMLLGVKLAVAAVAAAAVRRLIDGRSGAGALAGCLTLTAAQVLQIVLAGGLFNPGQTVTVGCTALLAAVFGWAFAHFPAREPRGVCLWLAVATACLQRCAVGPLAPGLALAAGAGLCAAIGGTLEPPCMVGSRTGLL